MTTPRRVPSAAAAFVWAVWLACTVAAFGLVNRYAGRTPYFDDFAFLPLQLFGDSTTLRDLWEPLNEHRVPLPKLVTWAVSRVVGYDPKAVMRVDLALVAAGAAALIAAARGFRGSTRFADAVFPLVTLSVGQADNFLWAVQVNFLLPAALLAGCLALITRIGPTLTAGRAAGIGALAVLLPLCGIQGQVPAVAVAVWLLGAGATICRTDRRSAAIAAGSGVVSFAVVAACVAGYTRPEHHPTPEPDWLAARYTVRVMGGAWGPTSEQLGPSEPTSLPTYFGTGTAAVLLLTGWWTLRACRDRASRTAATGHLAFLAGMLALCAAIGVGRGAVNAGALANRYATLAAPLVCWAYLAAVRFGPPIAGPVIASGLFLTACVVAWPNAAWGLDYARDWDAHQFRIDQDVKRGVPVSFLVEHHGAYLFPPESSYCGPVFEALRMKQVPPYYLIAAESKLKEVPVKWSLAAAPSPDRDGWYDLPARDHLRAEFTLDLPPTARGVVLRTSLRGTPRVTRSDLWWEEPADGREPIRRAVWNPLDVGEGRVKRIWLGRPVGRLHLTLDGPAAVRIDGVAALVEE